MVHKVLREVKGLREQLVLRGQLVLKVLKVGQELRGLKVHKVI